jgi:hypothetical protein
MPAAIPGMIKSRVITQWLQGLSRDDIALNNNISTGAVSNIINDWTNALSRYEADALRELGKSLKTAHLSPAQCAIGFRTMKVLSDQGIDGETAEYIISDTYKKCNSLGIAPSKVVTYIEDLIKFSDKIRLHEIEDYINQNIAKKTELEKKLQDLEDEISTLEEQKSELEKGRDLALEQKRKATEEMKSYFDVKQELAKYNISMTEDIQKFARTVKGIAKYRYEPQEVLREFEDNQYLISRRQAQEIIIDEKQKNLAKLKQHDRLLRHAINSHSEKLSLYNELEHSGFGLNELRRLLNTILDITSSYGIDAADKFFKDIETQYDAKLGFESEKESLKLKIQTLKEKRGKMLQILSAQPVIGSIIVKLLQLGFTENDILKMGEAYLNTLNRTFSLEDLAKGMIKTIDMVMTTTSSAKTTRNNDKLTEILSKVRQNLLQLDFSN